MRTIKPFPNFTDVELDDLRKKIMNGITENWNAADMGHLLHAQLEGKEWVNYPCWLHASKWNDGQGYFKFKFKGHSLYIHRASFEVFVEPVKPGLLVDHQCRVRGCCQYMHLEQVTTKENTTRGANRNHLMRNGAPSPIAARDINPHFFEEASAKDIDSEAQRRRHFNRDTPRVHSLVFDGPVVPPAPAGFEWQVSVASESLFILNPIRDKDHPLHNEALRRHPDLPYRDTDMLDAYHAYIDTSKDAPLPSDKPRFEYNPARGINDPSAPLFIPFHTLEPLGERLVVAGTPVHAENLNPDDPTDPHNDPLYGKIEQNGLVPENWVRRQLLRLEAAWRRWWWRWGPE